MGKRERNSNDCGRLSRPMRPVVGPAAKLGAGLREAGIPLLARLIVRD